MAGVAREICAKKIYLHIDLHIMYYSIENEEPL